MFQKMIITGAIIIALLGGASGAMIWKHYSDNTKETLALLEGTTGACQLLTLSEAQELLGPTTRQGSATGVGDQDSIDMRVTNCSYVRQAVAADASDAKTVTLSVHAAKTRRGSDKNAIVFSSQDTTSQQPIEGIGDAAYFDEFSSRLLVHKGNNLYIISGSIGIGGKADLETLKQAARSAGL